MKLKLPVDVDPTRLTCFNGEYLHYDLQFFHTSEGSISVLHPAHHLDEPKVKCLWGLGATVCSGIHFGCIVSVRQAPHHLLAI